MGVGHNLRICAGKQFDDSEERNCLVCECDLCVNVLSGMRVIKFQASE